MWATLGGFGCSVNTIRQAIFAIKTAHKRIGEGDITDDMHRIRILLGGLDRRNTARILIEAAYFGDE